jgi:hypothetical protein
VIVGSLFGVAAFTAAEDEAVEIATRGVYVLPKNPTAVITQGARVAWDATEKRIDLARLRALSGRHRHRGRRQRYRQGPGAAGRRGDRGGGVTMGHQAACSVGATVRLLAPVVRHGPPRFY